MRATAPQVHFLARMSIPFRRDATLPETDGSIGSPSRSCHWRGVLCREHTAQTNSATNLVRTTLHATASEVGVPGSALEFATLGTRVVPDRRLHPEDGGPTIAPTPGAEVELDPLGAEACAEGSVEPGVFRGGFTRTDPPAVGLASTTGRAMVRPIHRFALGSPSPLPFRSWSGYLPKERGPTPHLRWRER